MGDLPFFQFAISSFPSFCCCPSILLSGLLPSFQQQFLSFLPFHLAVLSATASICPSSFCSSICLSTCFASPLSVRVLPSTLPSSFPSFCSSFCAPLLPSSFWPCFYPSVLPVLFPSTCPSLCLPFSVPFCPSFHPFFPPIHSFFCLSFLPADSPAFFPFVHPFLSLSSLTSIHSYLYIPIIYQIHTFIVDKTDQQQQICIWGLLCVHLYFPPSVPCPLCQPDGGTWGQLKGLFLLLQEQSTHGVRRVWFSCRHKFCATVHSLCSVPS